MKALLVLSTILAALSSTMAGVKELFVSDEIVKNLGLKEAPEKLVEISYPSGVSVDLGKELTPTQVKDIPTLKWEAKTGVYYTVLMVSKVQLLCT